MPFRFRRRRPYRPRRPIRRRPRLPWYQKKYSVGQIASSAWRGVKYLKTLVNSEVKKLDQTGTGTLTETTAGVLHLTAIAQGDTDASRDGNSVLLKYGTIRGTLVHNSAGDAQQFCRLLVFQDKQQVSDTAPTLSPLLEGTYPYIAPLNNENLGRFTVLYDRMFTLDAEHQALTFKINLNLVGKHVRFNGANTTDVQKNGLYFGFIGSQATSNYPTITYYTRIGYHDN